MEDFPFHDFTVGWPHADEDSATVTGKPFHPLRLSLARYLSCTVQLQQLLMNLTLNGIEAIQDTGGVVTVKSQLGEDGPPHSNTHGSKRAFSTISTLR
jgi:hypothetical protein